MSIDSTDTDTEFFDGDPPRSGRRWLTWVAVAFGIVVVGAALLAGASALAGLAGGSTEPTVAPGREVTFEIPSGASARTIGAILEDAGVVASASHFERDVRNAGLADKLRAGSYTVITGGSIEDLLAVLTEGPPPAETYRVTVIEGLRIEQILESLASQTPYTVTELSAPLLDGSVTSPYQPEELGADLEPLAAWEGLLFPDTYDFVVDATPTDIVTRLADTMVNRVESIDWRRLSALGVDQYQAIVIASLVEKEAKLDEDRPLIASVIYNRLALGMPLQIDATIIYALGENPGRVLLSDLEIESPYNTYKYTGLPPTPIGGVRLTSLEAAANPADTGYLYYVVVSADGRHGFSETLEEHNRKKAQAKADGIIP